VCLDPASGALSAAQLLGAVSTYFMIVAVLTTKEGWTMDQEKIPFEPCCPDCPQN
jgi:hypothetical protein